MDTIRNGFPLSFRALSTDLRPYWNGQQLPSIDSGVELKGHRIIVPQAMRQSVLRDLHKAHQGMTRTKNRARRVIYWPGLTKDFEKMIKKLSELSWTSTFIDKWTSAELHDDQHPALPFQCTSADLFSVQGWPDFLQRVYVNRGRALIVLAVPAHHVMFSAVMVFRSWCTIETLKNRWRTAVFKTSILCPVLQTISRWRVEHVKSSPHYPQRNGLVKDCWNGVTLRIQMDTVLHRNSMAIHCNFCAGNLKKFCPKMANKGGHGWLTGAGQST